MRLTVKQLKNRDPGSGMAVIDRTALQELDVSSGDFVSIDDRVKVEPTEVEPAERVTVALPQRPRVSGDFGSYVREELADQAVTARQTLALSVGFGMLSNRSGRRIPLQIVDTDPSGPVVVQAGSDVEAVCREAAQIAVREHVHATAHEEAAAVESIELTMDHFEGTLEAVGVGGDVDTASAEPLPEAD